METWKKLSKIQRRDKWGRVCNKLTFFSGKTNSEICEPLMVAGSLILVVLNNMLEYVRLLNIRII